MSAKLKIFSYLLTNELDHEAILQKNVCCHPTHNFPGGQVDRYLFFFTDLLKTLKIKKKMSKIRIKNYFLETAIKYFGKGGFSSESVG